MKKKMGRLGITMLVLLLLTAFTGVMASAEECGYWTEQVDGEGRVVEVFVYTEPVVITEIEGEPMEPEQVGELPEPAGAGEPAQMMEAPVYLSDGAGASSAPTETAGITAGMIVLGVLSLAGLALVLYKAI